MSFGRRRGARRSGRGYGGPMETIRWGVLAPGRIAHRSPPTWPWSPTGSWWRRARAAWSARAAFAAEFGGTAHGSYEDLVSDPQVDVVYVASPHALHDEHTRLALEAGKPVLCEKPVTIEADSAAALFDEAATRGLFMMEAMWSACHPTIRKLLDLLAGGEYGTARQVHADLGFVVEADPTDRLLDPALGAGALLDMGIYPLTLAHLVLGEPERLAATANLSASGIDLDVAIAGLYPGGATAALTASMTSASPRTASVATEIGRFDLPRWLPPPGPAAVDGLRGCHRMDRARRARGRSRLRQRDPRGAPLPARGGPHQRAGAAETDPLPDAPDGRRAVADRRLLPQVRSPRESKPEEARQRRPRRRRQQAACRSGHRRRRGDHLAAITRGSRLCARAGDAGQQRRLDRLAR